MRTFEIPGSGGLMLSQRVQGLGDYYREGEEMLTFGQIEEAKEWITRLRANPGLRDQICIAGYRRTLQEHTFANRFAKAIEALKLTKKCPSDEHERTFDEIAADYKVGKTIRMTRAILESGGQFIFGKRRGTRAARRAAFEASLLLFGKRTYTAAGLPGRLFPHP